MATANKVCAGCGGTYTIHSSPVNIAKQKFCSRDCRNKAFKEIPAFEDRMREKLAERSEKQPNGCLLYTGQNNGTYGQIEYQRKTHLVHRVSYQLNKGEIPKGMCICHSCDTPLCINPDHLWLGTYRENTQDMLGKHRARYKPRRKLSDEQVEQIRNSDEMQIKIAERFHVSSSLVCAIKKGRRHAKTC